MTTILIRTSAIALRDIGGNGKSGAVQLICEEEVIAGKVASQSANRIGKSDRLLVHLEFLEGEGHG
jgi:hypothetical protein